MIEMFMNSYCETVENVCENNEHNFSVNCFNAPRNKIRGHVRRISNQIAVL